MNRKPGLKTIVFLILLLVVFIVGTTAEDQQKKPLTFQDVMKFKAIQNPVLSEDGLWIAYGTQPDRGDGETNIHALKSGKVFTVERGANPVISKNSRWVAMVVKPKAVDLEKAKEKKPKQGMALLETATGKVNLFDRVERFAFSDDSTWFAYHHFKEEEKPDEEEKKEKTEPEKGKKKEKSGSTLILHNLESGEETEIRHALSFAFAGSSKYLAYVIAVPEGKENGLFCLGLKKEDLPKIAIAKKEKGVYTSLVWSKKGSKLAFLEKDEENQDKGSRGASLWIWIEKSAEATQVVLAAETPSGWIIPEKNQLTWSEDERRLFFGFKPEDILDAEEEAEETKKEEELQETDLFDSEKILAKREVDVWHWNDPLINTHQKIMWPRIKDHTYLAVYDFDAEKFTQLADKDMPEVWATENPDFALGQSAVPYQKQITWYGRLNDVYLVNLKDGSRKKIVSQLEDPSSLSPGGRYVVFYKEKHWHLFDAKTGSIQNLTEKLNIPFYDEDHDYPSKVPGYGLAGWVEDDEAVLIYDKYDIWQFSTKTGQAMNITQGTGRKSHMIFRVLRLDPEKDFLKKDERLLLSSYHDKEKHYGFYSGIVGKPGIEKILEEKKRFRFLAKAKKADVLMYTRESFEEFPDIWISDAKFSSAKKVSNVNPQISDFAWGKPELVEWNSVDGIPLQGVLIKPGNYEPGKRYPVIVYFYRFFSQRLYEFNQMAVNHRPNFPFYTSNGYAIFLPDVRFEVGFPGFSATKCIVPGVQKLIDMGIADPQALGLHGHSWSGYQTAFMITQTNIFTAAIAGAPVSNMTSAYSGIRWGSGLARQFQYEKTQSRIGGSLWEYLERYIENSPVFFADRIQTPMLIMFGDEDGAVPWYQGIELYLAMRRLEKDCIFLQYRGEPHHPQKYANKLDYSIKMKEYFDHYLKGKPAPEWITKGVPYRGN